MCSEELIAKIVKESEEMDDAANRKFFSGGPKIQVGTPPVKIARSEGEILERYFVVQARNFSPPCSELVLHRRKKRGRKQMPKIIEPGLPALRESKEPPTTRTRAKKIILGHQENLRKINESEKQKRLLGRERIQNMMLD